MIIIIAEPGKKVHLGRIGENEARAVQFDISQTQAEFPGASFSVLNMRPQDPDAYPVNGQFIRIEGSNLYWTLQSGDLTEDGLGECELKATVDGVIVKSEIWTTEICPALDGNGEPPEPWESWQQQVEEDADRAEDAAELLEHPGAEAETLPAGSQATASYADGVFTFGIPKGKDGLDGDTPTASVSKVGNTATITITDKDGTTTAQISDGTDGEDGFSPSASVTKSGKTATISITDKEETTTAQISDGEDGEPGAVPIISIGTVTTLPAGSSATASMDTTDPEHPVLSMGIPKGDPGEVTEAELTAATTELKSAIDGKADLIHDTVQNVAIASVPDGAANLPLTALKFRVEPIQAGSGDPSPQNQRAISGRTSAVVSVTGKNLFDKSTVTEGKCLNGDTLVNKTWGNLSDWISVKAGVTYYLSNVVGSNSLNPGSLFDENKQYVETLYSAGNDTSFALTIPDGVAFMRLNVRTTHLDDAQVEVGSTASAYEAFNGQTYPISWETEAGTVYGGYVDWVAGQLVLTQALQTKTGSNVQQVGQSSAGVWWTLLGGFDYPTEATSSQNMSRQRSNMYVPSANAQTDCSFRIFGGSPNTLYAYNNTLDTLEKAQDFYNANNLQIWYPLATPITVQLSNLDEIRTVEGQMNLWSDSGDIVEMTYPCDTKGYVEKRLSASQNLMELIVTANRESEMKATKAYSTGNLLIVNGTLYRATTSIANGATLTVGTNVTATTVAAEIAALS